MLAVILVVLQVLGALPSVIEFFKYVWGLTQKVEDKKERIALRSEGRRAVLASLVKKPAAAHGMAADESVGTVTKDSHSLDHVGLSSKTSAWHDNVWAALHKQSSAKALAVHEKVTAAFAPVA